MIDKQTEARAHAALIAELDRRIARNAHHASIARYEQAVRDGKAGSPEALRQHDGWAAGERELAQRYARHFGQVTTDGRDALDVAREQATGLESLTTAELIAKIDRDLEALREAHEQADAWGDAFAEPAPGSLAQRTGLRPNHEAPAHLTPAFGDSPAEHFRKTVHVPAFDLM